MISLTPSAEKALGFARDNAFKLDHPYVGTEHLILGLLQVDGPISAELRTQGLEYSGVFATIEQSIGRARRAPEIDRSAYPLTPRVEKTLRMAEAQARELGRARTDCTHILLAIIQEGQGVASAILRGSVVRTDELRRRVLEIDAASD